ncbi:Uncharacterised protein [Vibrio cholerae]|nr:Uncharacterised protein [Vibrio cholerae]
MFDDLLHFESWISEGHAFKDYHQDVGCYPLESAL